MRRSQHSRWLHPSPFLADLSVWFFLIEKVLRNISWLQNEEYFDWLTYQINIFLYNSETVRPTKKFIMTKNILRKIWNIFCPFVVSEKRRVQKIQSREVAVDWNFCLYMHAVTNHRVRHIDGENAPCLRRPNITWFFD